MRNSLLGLEALRCVALRALQVVIVTELEVSENEGYLFGGPYNRDSTVVLSVLHSGPPDSENGQISMLVVGAAALVVRGGKYKEEGGSVHLCYYTHYRYHPYPRFVQTCTLSQRLHVAVWYIHGP